MVAARRPGAANIPHQTSGGQERVKKVQHGNRTTKQHGDKIYTARKRIQRNIVINDNSTEGHDNYAETKYFLIQDRS